MGAVRYQRKSSEVGKNRLEKFQVLDLGLIKAKDNNQHGHQ